MLYLYLGCSKFTSFLSREQRLLRDFRSAPEKQRILDAAVPAECIWTASTKLSIAEKSKQALITMYQKKRPKHYQIR